MGDSISIKSHVEQVCVYRLKSFDMIFFSQLTANPFIVKVIKRNEMTSFFVLNKKQRVRNEEREGEACCLFAFVWNL